MAAKAAVQSVEPAADLRGDLEVPGDKSISHRAVILGALSVTPTRVENFLNGEDCLSTVNAFRQMGIRIEQDKNNLEIHGKGLEGLRAPAQPINCGNSGTTARLLMGVLTGQPFEVELRGDASLSKRPMSRVIEPLTRMGATFPTDATTLPLKIRGCHSVRTLAWKSPVASAQVKSAILLAGLYASGETSVEEPSLSRDHTERMLRASGVDITRKDLRVIVRGTATVNARDFKVPGDLSSAAFFLAAGVLLSGAGIKLRRVGVNATRTGFLDVLKAMGADLKQDAVTESGGEPVADIYVKKSALKATQISGELIPRTIDEIPILAVLATQAQGKTGIRDAAELRVKESDRLAALRAELTKMGARITEQKDGLEIEGPTPLRGAVVTSYGDHRLAMSLAVAALVAQGRTTIEDVACIETSFPNFWMLMDQVRGR